MSLGSTVDLSTADGRAEWNAWTRVIRYADRMGTVVVAAAGNDSLKLGGNTEDIPAGIDNVVAVSATGSSNLQMDNAGNYNAAPHSDVLAFYSNYGRPIDMAAPGGDCGPTFDGSDWNICYDNLAYWILSDYVYLDDAGVELGWAFMIGTSMASPHVAGVAGLIRAEHPRWGTAQVRGRLRQAADRIGSPVLFGGGLVDAATSVGR